MKKQAILVFGSCVSRDVFTKKMNTNWQQFFSLQKVLFQSSIISLGSDKSNCVDHDCNEFIQRSINNDFDKSFLRSIAQNSYDVLLIDLFSDINFGVIKSSDDNFITNNPQAIGKTKYHSHLDSTSILTINDDTLKFFSEFNKSAMLIASKIEQSACKLIIFNYYRPATHYQFNNKIVASFKLRTLLKKFINLFTNEKQSKINATKELYLQKQLFSILEFHLQNQNIEVINQNTANEYLASKVHPFGLSTVHYEDKYYHDFLNRLISICNTNLKI